MKLKLFLTILTLATINQSFSVIPLELVDLNTQLALATLWGDNAKIASLVQAGAEVNAKGNNLLRCAIRNGHTSTVGLLLSLGADIDTINDSGYTPFHAAALLNHKPIVKLLLSHGADITIKSNDGSTPFHAIAMNSDREIVELLLSKGADVNAKDNDGYTPLNIAALKGNIEIVELLLAHGADINARSNDGWTPQSLAGAGSKTEELLKAYQALLAQAQKPTKALLKVAIEHGYYDLVKLLLQKGLKPDANDLQRAKEKGETAQHKQSYKAIGRMLITHLSLAPGKALSISGRIAKAGIVDLHGLSEDIAEKIARYLE